MLVEEGEDRRIELLMEGDATGRPREIISTTSSAGGDWF
jgi:hypothetical protein